LKKCQVATAANAEAGLAAANDLRPALIITDRNMPGGDGIEFCHQLKRNPDLAEIPVVLSSAGDEPQICEQPHEIAV
jgi:CheY-like chemotaxis protein